MQFTTTDRLEPAIALLSVVAVTLLNLREASRRDDAKTRRADTLLSWEYVEVLSLTRYGKVREDLTVSEFFLALARLGGHQNRKCDGHPGWLVLWRGWMKLQDMLDGHPSPPNAKLVVKPKVETQPYELQAIMAGLSGVRRDNGQVVVRGGLPTTIASG